jgi:predicted Zn-dependent peptidase
VAAFESLPVGEGVLLHHLPVDRFKSVTCRVVFHLPLNPRAAEAALIPPLLRRGTRRHPDLVSIGRRLDDLYGAALDGDVSRVGERQILDLAIDIVAPRHLPGRVDVLAEGLAFQRELLLEPRLEEGRFPAEIYEQERENLARVVEGLLDDRIAYATERCLARMCEGEPYENYPYGTPGTIRAARNESVVARHRSLLRSAPTEMFVVGPADRREVEEAAGALARALGERQVEVPPAPVSPAVRPPRRFSEEMALDQAKLVLGFRVATRPGPAEDPGLALFATILGGGPFSKLFRKVREERSLAYYASASLERPKGLLLLHAGIDAAKEGAVTELCLAQVEALARGEIDDTELDAARRAIRARLKGLGDSPSGLISYAVERGLLGRVPVPASEEEAIATAGRDEVVEAARRVRLDTVFLLRPPGGAA